MSYFCSFDTCLLELDGSSIDPTMPFAPMAIDEIYDIGYSRAVSLQVVMFLHITISLISVAYAMRLWYLYNNLMNQTRKKDKYIHSVIRNQYALLCKYFSQCDYINASIVYNDIICDNPFYDIDESDDVPDDDAPTANDVNDVPDDDAPPANDVNDVPDDDAPPADDDAPTASDDAPTASDVNDVPDDDAPTASDDAPTASDVNDVPDDVAPTASDVNDVPDDDAPTASANTDQCNISFNHDEFQLLDTTTDAVVWLFTNAVRMNAIDGLKWIIETFPQQMYRNRNNALITLFNYTPLNHRMVYYLLDVLNTESLDYNLLLMMYLKKIYNTSETSDVLYDANMMLLCHLLKLSLFNSNQFNKLLKTMELNISNDIQLVISEYFADMNNTIDILNTPSSLETSV